MKIIMNKEEEEEEEKEKEGDIITSGGKCKMGKKFQNVLKEHLWRLKKWSEGYIKSSLSSHVLYLFYLSICSIYQCVDQCIYLGKGNTLLRIGDSLPSTSPFVFLILQLQIGQIDRQVDIVQSSLNNKYQAHTFISSGFVGLIRGRGGQKVRWVGKRDKGRGGGDKLKKVFLHTVIKQSIQVDSTEPHTSILCMLMCIIFIILFCGRDSLFFLRGGREG